MFSSADFFFKISFLKKTPIGTLTECQTVWIQIRTDILSVLIWVQTVCNGYQQMTKVPPQQGKGECTTEMTVSDNTVISQTNFI